MKAVFDDTSTDALGDPHRRSFRRKAIRQGGKAMVITVAVMHLVTILFVVVPRGLFDGSFAFMWSLVNAAPTMLVHALAALIFGMFLSLVLLVAGSFVYGIFSRGALAPMRQPALSLKLAVLGLILTGAFAALAQVQNPFVAWDLGMAAFVPSLVPALGGALWGVLLARNLSAYLSERLPKNLSQ